MTFINYASREINCKIVYYGPGLCGKTTNIQWIHEQASPDKRGKLVKWCGVATDIEDRKRAEQLQADLAHTNRVSLLGELARAAEQRRGCHRCARAECPRCPFPGLDDRTYCSTIRRSAPSLRTLNRIRLYSRLPSAVARQQDRMAAE
jgi:hypothetical protein